MKKSTQVLVEPLPPFNFDGTVYVPHYFATPDVAWQPDNLWQTLNVRGEIYGLKMVNRGSVNDPGILVTIFSDAEPSDEGVGEILRELDWRYGLSEDLGDFYGEFEGDEFLGPIFGRWLGMKANCGNSLYELMIISIVLQNATVRRTVQMMNSLFEAYGEKLRFDDRELYAYWSPSALGEVDENELRALKVGYRAKTIKRISEAFASGAVDERRLRGMETEEARRELMRLPGVGPATAQILLGGSLRRYDTFDLRGRLWEQKILSRVMFDKEMTPIEEIVDTFSERYGRWRGLSLHYILTDLFWRHREKKIDWLDREIRL